MTPFEKARKIREEAEAEAKRKEEEKKRNSYTRSADYEEISWLGMTREPKVFRILGYPAETRESSTDSKIVYWSKIVHDNHKSFINIYFPQTASLEIDKDWILYRLYEKVNESKWIDYKEGDIKDLNRPRSTDKGYYISTYEGTPSFIRIRDNKKENSSQFGHFYPKKRVLMNVIDRMDDWCKTNKHSKILTSNHSPFDITDDSGQKKTIFFNDVGMPNEFYKTLYSQVLEFRSTWDLDLIVHKEDKKYVIRDAFEDKIPTTVKSLVNGEALTKEESEYQLYDLDKLFRPTGYYKLMNGLEKLFKQVDIDLGTKFFDELKHLTDEEKEQREKEKAESEKTQHPSAEIPSTPKEEIKEEPKEEVPSRRKTNEVPSVKSKLETTPHWNKLTDSDKEDMLKWCTDVDGEKFSYKEGASLIPCSCQKKINYPDSTWNCTMCGVKFE